MKVVKTLRKCSAERYAFEERWLLDRLEHVVESEESWRFDFFSGVSQYQAKVWRIHGLLNSDVAKYSWGTEIHGHLAMEQVCKERNSVLYDSEWIFIAIGSDGNEPSDQSLFPFDP